MNTKITPETIKYCAKDVRESTCLGCGSNEIECIRNLEDAWKELRELKQGGDAE